MKRFAVLISMGLLSTSSVLIPGNMEANAMEPIPDGLGDCTMKANDPHRGKRGIDTKSTIKCDRAKKSVMIWVLLYKCPRKPKFDTTWLLEHCNQRAGNRDPDIKIKANKKVTRQAPPPGGKRLKAAGWWANQTNFTNNRTDDFENKFASRKIPPAN